MTVLQRDAKTGIPLRVRVPQQDGDGYVEMTSTIDARGFVRGGSIVGAGTDGILVWSQPVDDNGLPTGEGRTASGQKVEHLAFDTEWGLPTSVRRTCDTCLTHVSDGFGNTATVKTSITELYTYDVMGRFIQQSDNVSGRLTQWRYDGAGRVIFESSTGDETPATAHMGDYETTTTFKQVGSTLTTTAVLHRRERIEAGEIVDEAFTTVSVSERGLTKKITDPVGVVSTYKYDTNECRLSSISSVGGGKTTEVRFAASTTPGAVKEQAVYEISANPEIADTLLSTEEFDEQGRVVRRTSEANEGTELLSYSASGLLMKRSYGDGHVVENEYDSLGRLVTMVSAATSAVPKRAVFTRFSNFTQGTLPGSMTTKQKGDESFTYDVFGAVVLSEQSVKSLKLTEWSSELSATVAPVRIKRTRLSDYTYDATTTVDEYNTVQSPDSGILQRKLTREVSAEGRVLSEVDGRDQTRISYSYERDSRGMIAKTTTTIADANGQTLEKFEETQGAGTSEMKRLEPTNDTRKPNGVLERQSFYSGGTLRRRDMPLENYGEVFSSYDGGQARTIVRQPTERPQDVTTTVRAFDDAGRVLSEQRVDGIDASASTGVRVETTYVDGADQTTFSRRVEQPIGTVSRMVIGKMDGNGRVVVEEAAPLTLYHEYDAAGVLRSTQTPTGIAKTYANEMPFLLDNADGGKTIIGYREGLPSEREVLVVPAAVWTESSIRCTYAADPTTDLDPDAIARLIIAGRIGNSNTALRQMTSELMVNGKPRCEVLALTQVAGQESAVFLEGARRAMLEAEMAVAGLLIPGPEDLIIAYGLRQLGELAARRAALRAGLGAADDALNAAKGAVCRIGATPCFVAGTQVRTDRGLIPIEEIEVGDLVWAGDEVTGYEGLRPIAQVFITEGSAILDLEVVNDAGARETLGTTGEHPFYVEARGFVPAHRLEPGDRIVATDDEVLTIASSTWRATTDRVFNLEVEDFHTYFVGESGAWVHNNSGCGPTFGELRQQVRTLASHPAFRTPEARRAAFEEGVQLYRGVAPTHYAQYAAAKGGRAIPIGGTASAAAHTAGNTASGFTSWSTERWVSTKFANDSTVMGFIRGKKGVVMTKRVHPSMLTRSRNARADEFEFLLRGEVVADGFVR